MGVFPHPARLSGSEINARDMGNMILCATPRMETKTAAGLGLGAKELCFI